MRKLILTAAALIFLSCVSSAGDDAGKDPNQLFYKGNLSYEKGDYAKASEAYLAALSLGVESGSVYYNLGNCFFKMGKLGYAILYFEKARRIMPADSDLKSNLDFARSMIENATPDSRRPLPVRAILIPFRDFNMNSMTVFTVIFYLVIVVFAAVIMANPIWARRLKLAFILLSVLFAVTAGAFLTRYYYEEFLVRGIVVAKDAECKYEPIDKASAYYNLKEGNRVIILKTRNGWRQIRRLDGKMAWIAEDAVREI